MKKEKVNEIVSSIKSHDDYVEFLRSATKTKASLMVDVIKKIPLYMLVE